MLILALDTTTRAGSLALVRDGALLETFVGDEGRTHATRLPGDILDTLARHGRALADIDLFGVAAGPGSFTGLRIGIATVQGLAFALGRQVVGVSALDALAEAAGTAGAEAGATGVLGAWMDAQRGEVYACLYRLASGRWTAVTPPLVQRPEVVLAAWEPVLGGSPAAFVGDGALTYREGIERALGASACVIRPVPPLAPAIARIAAAEAEAGRAVHPHAVRPVYIRRPDAELARDRRAGLGR
jgi:tRNA threonylcarbamoyladenosine biosynthesis protein TsaB